MALLRENGEREYAIYTDPSLQTYKILGMVSSFVNPETAPGYVTSGYWSKVGAGEFSVGVPGTLLFVARDVW